jgi:hypothetical protein
MDDKVTSWEDLSQSIARMIAAGDLQEALEMLGNAEKDHGDEATFHLLKGDILWASEDLREGFASY